MRQVYRGRGGSSAPPAIRGLVRRVRTDVQVPPCRRYPRAALFTPKAARKVSSNPESHCSGTTIKCVYIYGMEFTVLGTVATY